MEKTLSDSEKRALNWLSIQTDSLNLVGKLPDFYDCESKTFYEIKMCRNSPIRGDYIIFPEKQYVEFKKINPVMIIMEKNRTDPKTVCLLSELGKSYVIYSDEGKKLPE